MKNNENKYMDKKIRKYVIATTDGKYLRKDMLSGKYYFIEDIEAATKAERLSVAKDFLKYYYFDTNMLNNELVIIPVDITYELIDETN